MGISLTNLEIHELIFQWYKKLDIHAPVEDLLPLVHSSDLEMKFPEITVKSVEDFKKWYASVTNKFFDEVHELKMLNIENKGDLSEVKLVVNWQAKIWDPPAAKSDWIGMDAYQSLIIKKDLKTGRAAIAVYIVDKMEALTGSAAL
jgi:hypothetical protein